MLMPIFYTTTNTRKRKNVKYTSADQKRKQMILKQEWEDLIKRHSVRPSNNKKVSTYTPSQVFHRETPQIPSRDSGYGNATKPVDNQKVYTGSKIIGIGTLHKSNAVPVFSEDEATEMARMRRG